MAAPHTRLAFKCTDEHMKCRSAAFQLGVTARYRSPLAMCERGFHFCRDVQALQQYKDFTKSRLFLIRYGHALIKDDKGVTDELTLVEEVTAHTLAGLLASQPYRDIMAKNAAGLLLFLCSTALEVDGPTCDALVQRGAVEDSGVRAQALQLASRYGHLAVVRALVEAGENIHANRDYALRWAAQCGHLPVVQFLVSRGAHVHADDDYALRWAAVCGHLPVVDVLLHHGADVHAKNDYALRYGAQHVVAFLRHLVSQCAQNVGAP